MKVYLNDNGEIEAIEHTKGGKVALDPDHSVDWESGEDQDYDKVFEGNLAKAVRILQKGNVAFGGSNSKRKYDATYWKTGTDRDGDEILILKFGTPAQAVQSMFSKPNAWSLDCIEYLQVIRWYALLSSSDDKTFNKLGTTGTFKLSYHQTTGLRSRQTYMRDRARGAFSCVDGLTGRSTPTEVTLSTIDDEDEFLDKLPIGTRVMWADASQEARDEDFENENAMVLGRSQKTGVPVFIAHPYGVKSAGSIRREMSNPEDPDDANQRDAYIRRYVYVKEVEWYARTL